MKKATKKLLASILAVFTLLACIPLQGFTGIELPEFFVKAAERNVIQEGVCGDNASYTYYSDGSLEITGTGVISLSQNTDFGDELRSINIGEGITEIAQNAFSNRTTVKKVKFPSTLKTIGSNAFSGCSGLSSIIFSSGLEKIGGYAFYGCSALLSVTLPEGLQSIGKYAFAACSLNDIYIPGSVTNIEASALYMNSSESTNVYYGGLSEEQWNSIYTSNSYIGNITIHYTYHNNHNVIEDEKEPTCTEVGYTYGTYCEDCKLYITGHNEIPMIEHYDYNYDDICDGCEKVLAQKINVDETVTVEIGENEKIYLSFTPSGTGIYSLESFASVDTAVNLLDKYKNIIASDDDSGENGNFKLSQKLSRNIKYLFEISNVLLINSSFDIKLTLDEKLPEEYLGDVDGDSRLSAADARLVLRTSVGIESLSENQYKLADVDRDGRITASDTRPILRAAAGLENFLERPPKTELPDFPALPQDKNIGFNLSLDSDTLTATMSMDDFLDFKAADLTLTYNSDALEFVPATKHSPVKTLSEIKLFGSEGNDFASEWNFVEPGTLVGAFYIKDTLDANEWDVDVDMASIDCFEFKFNPLSAEPTDITISGCVLIGNDWYKVEKVVTYIPPDEPTTSPDEPNTPSEPSETDKDIGIKSYVEDGIYKVILSLQNCLGFTAGNLKIQYDSSIIEVVPFGTTIAKVLPEVKLFTDAGNDFTSAFVAETNGEINGAFYFKDVLDAESWGVPVNMANIECFELHFKILDDSKNIELKLTGELKFGDQRKNIEKTHILEHFCIKIEIPAIEATCTTAGTTAGFKCSVCEEVLTAPVATEKLGHDLNTDIATEPTCTEAGVKIFSCLRCDYTGTEAVDALGHNEIIIAGVTPTCTSAGVSNGKVCLVCKKYTVEQQPLNRLPHNYFEEITPPTCTEKGFTTFICSGCDNRYNGNYLSAIAHKDDDANGYCEICGNIVADYPPTEPEQPEECSCRCHKTDIFSKIVYFFLKLFKIMENTCECGAAHY